MVDDRDKYKSKHPTPLATPVIQGFEPTPVSNPVIRESESSLQSIERRSRETKNTTLETIDRIEALRREARDDVKAVHAKVDGVIAVVSDLRVAVGEGKSQNEMILERLADLKAHAENTQKITTTKRVAEVEVETTRQLTDIEIGKKRATTEIEASAAAAALKRDITREFAMKVVIALLAGAVIVLLAWLTKRYA